MKLSFCASENASPLEPVLFRASYIEAVKTAKALGYDGVEIHVRDPKTVQSEELSRVCKDTRIMISGVATGLAKRIDGLTLVDDNIEIRQAAITRLKEHLDLCEIFGCAALIGSLRGNISAPEKKFLILDRLSEALCTLDEYIQDKNCYVELEAINRYENNYLNTVEETANFVKTLGCKKIKVLADLFHMNIEENSFVRPIEKYIYMISRIHFADNNRHYPGAGMIDFKEIIDCLNYQQFDGWISIEALPIPNEMTALEKSLHIFKI